MTELTTVDRVANNVSPWTRAGEYDIRTVGFFGEKARSLSEVKSPNHEEMQAIHTKLANSLKKPQQRMQTSGAPVTLIQGFSVLEGIKRGLDKVIETVRRIAEPLISKLDEDQKERLLARTPKGTARDLVQQTFDNVATSYSAEGGYFREDAPAQAIFS